MLSSEFDDELAIRLGEGVERDEVASSRDDDGNRVRGILGRQNRLRPPRYDQVHLDPNQVGRQLRKPLVQSVGGSVLDDEMLPLHVSELLHAPEKAIKAGRIE